MMVAEVKEQDVREGPTRRVTGYNHELIIRGKRFHIQTEDLGDRKREVSTILFTSGAVLARTTTAYPAGLVLPDDAPRLKRFVRDCHRAMLVRLRDEHAPGAQVRPEDPEAAASAHDPCVLAPAAIDGSTKAANTQNPPPPTAESMDSALQARLEQIKDQLDMSNVNETLNTLFNEVTGSLGAALVDHESGMALGTVGNGINLEVAAAGNMEVVRAKMRVMEALEIDGGIEDMLITLKDQYHIIRPVGDTLFLYLAFDRKTGNLAMARHKMSAAANNLQV